MTQQTYTPPVAILHKTRSIVGQDESLQQIKEALLNLDKGSTCQVVLIEEAGGIGKTRLLEEVLRRAGHRDWREKRPLTDIETKTGFDWSQLPTSQKKILVSDPLDFIDTRLLDRDTFVKRLRDSLRHAQSAANFNNYDRKYYQLQQVQAFGSELHRVEQIADETAAAFLEDLKKITEKQPVIFPLDTTEILNFITSVWSIAKGILHPETDLARRTRQWFIRCLKEGQFSNTLFIIAGRPPQPFDESSLTPQDQKPLSFFEQLRSLANISITDIAPYRFDQTQTKTFFEQLVLDWKDTNLFEKVKEVLPDGLTQKDIYNHFQEIVDSERYKILWLYTDGVPLRLAMYAELIFSINNIPRSLQEKNYEQVCRQLEIPPHWQPDQPVPPKLVEKRAEIEKDFIDTLFSPRSLRSRILQALVRAPHGLNAIQLHYILDNPNQLDPKTWLGSIDYYPKRLKEIIETLKKMGELYLVKPRTSLTDFAVLLEAQGYTESEIEPFSYRIGLQDEVYDIYAKLKLVDKQRKDESEARANLYEKLQNWADYYYQKYLAQKRTNMEKDEASFEAKLILYDSRTFRLPDLPSREIQIRASILEVIHHFETERMIYALYRAPEKNFNVYYSDIGLRKSFANNPKDDWRSQTETRAIINNQHYVLDFANIEERPEVLARGETTVRLLSRLANQEDITRRLKHFVLSGNYRRAIEFSLQAERVIKNLPRITEQQRNYWHSWNHTLQLEEINIWRAYAKIFISEQTPDPLEILKRAVDNLIRLLEGSREQDVFWKDDGTAQYAEKGFQGIAEKNIKPHPAIIRLSRMISHTYNILGYGYIIKGKIRQAVKYYNLSLYYIRSDKQVDAHRAVVLNNLSRALSNMGYASAAVVCQDGLNLRQQLGDEVPLAYSYNTMALIYDDWQHTIVAQNHAAKAIAYFRRASSERGLGLAYILSAEALRHISTRIQVGELALVESRQLLDASNDLLKQAEAIFHDKVEIVRKVEVLVELLTLRRDQIQLILVSQKDLSGESRGYYDDAVGYLEQILQLSDGRFRSQEMDAQISFAQICFYMGENSLTEKLLREIEEKVPSEYLLTKTDTPKVEELDDLWIFWQMSRVHSLRAEMALQRFVLLGKQLKEQMPSDDGEVVKLRHHRLAEEERKTEKRFLEKAVTGYCLSLGYAETLVSGSHITQRLYDNLYNSLKSFNQVELELFYNYLGELRSDYPYLKAILLLESFLPDFLGVLPPKRKEGL